MTISLERSRITKALVDFGACSFPDADARLAGLTLAIHVDPAVADEPAAQAATLTAVLTGVRCFAGGLWVTGAIDRPLVLPFPSETIGEAAIRLGARADAPSATRTILIGGRALSGLPWQVRAWWNAWEAGVRPRDDDTAVGDGRNSLSGIAAGALAVAQAFSSGLGNPLAGRFPQIIPLWDPTSTVRGPQRFYLPDALWLVGLGNLGHAYIWCLSLLPYLKGSELSLLLQDNDTVRDVNWGTSVLVEPGRYGMLKTKLAEDWALDRGFLVRRYDQYLNHRTVREPTDPPIALSGLDRMGPRKLLGGLGFERVVDCGLGSTSRKFDQFRLNVFSKDYTPAMHFEDTTNEKEEQERREILDRNLSLPAYNEGESSVPGAKCGMTELAGASVAVPFVSMFVAALAITQVIRIASGYADLMSVVGRIGNLGDLRVSSRDVSSILRIGCAEASDWTHCRPR